MESLKIKRIYYNYRVARGSSFDLEIKKDGQDYYLHSRFDDPENSYKPTDLIWQGQAYNKIIEMFFDRIIKLFVENDVLSWDGFDGYDLKAKDGWGFNLNIDFESGKSLTAAGENDFPEKYSVVKRELYQMIKEIIEIYHQ